MIRTSLVVPILIFATLSVFALPARNVSAQEKTKEQLEEYADFLAKIAYKKKSRQEYFKKYLLGEPNANDIVPINDLMAKPECHEALLWLMKSRALSPNLELKQFAVAKLYQLAKGKQVPSLAKSALEEVQAKNFGLISSDATRYLEDLEKGDTVDRRLTTEKFPSFTSILPKQKHPTEQNEKQRNKTFQDTEEKARNLVEREKYLEFVERYCDPYCFARFPKILPSEQARQYARKLIIHSARQNELAICLQEFCDGRRNWTLNNRAVEIDSAVSCGIWIFREGRWYFSPILIFDSLQNFQENEKLTSKFEKFFPASAVPNAPPIPNKAARLKRLRAAHLEAIEIVEKRDAESVFAKVICPVNVLRLASASDKSINQWCTNLHSGTGYLSRSSLLSRRMELKGEMPNFWDELKQELERTSKRRPTYVLDGRIAFYRKPPYGNTRWEFYEGHWRMAVKD